MTAAEVIATLTQARQTRGIGRVPLSTRMGWAGNAVYRWETGRCDPPLNKVVEWAAALGYAVALVPVAHADESPDDEPEETAA